MGGRVLSRWPGLQRDQLFETVDLAVTTATLCGSSGVRAVIAENLVLNQQLIALP